MTNGILHRAAAVAVVSESLARRFRPGENPIGKRLKPNFSGSVWCTVVGVAGDVRHWGADVDIEPTAYYPYTQIPDSIRQLLEADMGFAVRSNLGQSDLLRSIRSAVAGIDKNLPVYEVTTMDSMVADSSSLRRFDLSLLANILRSGAVVGCHRSLRGHVLFRFSADQGDWHSHCIGGGFPRCSASDPASSSAACHCRRTERSCGAFFLRKILASLLYGLSDNDPITLLSVPLVMILVVLLACYLPARRAAKVDPLVTLRYE